MGRRRVEALGRLAPLPGAAPAGVGERPSALAMLGLVKEGSVEAVPSAMNHRGPSPAPPMSAGVSASPSASVASVATPLGAHGMPLWVQMAAGVDAGVSEVVEEEGVDPYAAAGGEYWEGYPQAEGAQGYEWGQEGGYYPPEQQQYEGYEGYYGYGGEYGEGAGEGGGYEYGYEGQYEGQYTHEGGEWVAPEGQEAYTGDAEGYDAYAGAVDEMGTGWYQDEHGNWYHYDAATGETRWYDGTETME